MPRELSPKTKAVYAILTKTKGAATFGSAKDELAAAGTKLEGYEFNNIKAYWKRQQAGKNGRPDRASSGKKKSRVGKAAVARAVARVSADEAVAFVQGHGGFKEAKAAVIRDAALLAKFEEITALV
jgi:hypothetical protein